MTSQQTPKQGVLAIGTLHRTSREYFVGWRVLSIWVAGAGYVALACRSLPYPDRKTAE